MAIEDLVEYIRINRAKYSDDTLRKVVLDAGWSTEDVAAAFAKLGAAQLLASVPAVQPPTVVNLRESVSQAGSRSAPQTVQPVQQPAAQPRTYQRAPVTVQPSTMQTPVFVDPGRPTTIARSALVLEVFVVLISLALVILAVLLVWSGLLPKEISDSVGEFISKVIAQ